jgi:hypothetical protein
MNISTIEEANAYMPRFIEDYNKRFAKIPLQATDAHRPLQKHEMLKDILCFKEERTVSNSLTIQHDRVLHLIEDTVENRALRRKKIMLHEYTDGSLNLFDRGRKLNFTKLYDRVEQPIEQGIVVPNVRIGAALSFIKEKQLDRDKKRRSTKVLRKRHLGIIHRPKKQPYDEDTTSLFSRGDDISK